MKFNFKSYTIIGLTVISMQSHAADLLKCTNSDKTTTSEFRVYESPLGYSFEIKECDLNKNCHSNSGPINRDITPTNPAMTFYSDKVRIIHVFGEYLFSGGQSGTLSEFPDKGCTLNQGDDIVGLGELRIAPTGSCGSYSGIAKSRAKQNAEAKCGSQVMQIGAYILETQCHENEDVIIARSIFRCIR